MRSIIMMLSIFVLCGCGTTAKFVYPSKDSRLVRLDDKPVYDLTAAVLPLEEGRDDRNSFGGVYLYLVPLVPYGSIDYARPDAARLFSTISEFQFDVSEDLAKAVATSLRRSNLFKDVFFTYGGEKDKADIIISGDILSTHYKGKIYSYGLSIFGPALGFFGLPLGSATNTLNLKLYASEVAVNSPFWEFSFSKDRTTVQGWYYNWGTDCKGYVTLMEEAMNEAIPSLNKSLETYVKNKRNK